ncbi:hypothetical protein [Duganella aceris]|uniref:DUF1302 family protein n=1 Tax=Duganella aceris TaxID=2703883 RepID=A0ABX0FLF3_9BURK|nr:hypothetical protein [Duganella aceris]NGZ85364.1 hypothetical protein [Duganella aceris]
MSAPTLTAAALLLALAGAGARAQSEAPAADKEPAAGGALGDELREGFYSRLNVLAFGVYNDLRDGQRASNVLGFPRSQAEIDFRPDFSLSLRRFDFGLKPRLLYARDRLYERVGEDDTDTRHRGYINEAYVRFRATENVTAILSRENLQWGPSALVSASNPFNPNNGKGNPNVELPGLDYVRLVAVPSPEWTVSLISNFRPGRLNKDDQVATTGTGFPASAQLAPPVGVDYSLLQREPFEKTHAVKLDYTGDGYYASAIVSHRRRGANRLGLFGGWNASDALMLYAEGSAEREQAAQRAQGAGGAPRRLLAGASYTLESGPTFSAEYFHNRSGCTLEPLLACGAAAPPRLPLLRRRYALLQYVDTKLLGSVNLVVRVIRNLDDHSTLSTANVEWEVGEHVQLYLVPTVSSGHDGAEFPNLPKRSLFFGLSYTY